MARKLVEVPSYHLVPNWFPTSVQDHRLEASEILTFLAMCSLCDRDRLVTAPTTTIATRYRISVRSVKRALPVLVERGFLVDLGAPAARRPRHYRVTQAKPLPPAPAFPTNVRAIHEGSGWMKVVE